MPLEEALTRFLGQFELPARGEAEETDVRSAGGRVTAEAVFARRSCPHYHASAMDGVALRARETFGASGSSPVRLQIGPQAVVVDTGDPLPPGMDAVVMIENVEISGGEVILIAPAVPWQHVRSIGEDIVAADLLLTSGRRLSAPDLAALLAAGVNRVKVRPRPRVAIIPTGTEVVPPEGDVGPGQIPESNSAALAELVRDWGGEARVMPIVPDDTERLIRAVRGAAENHEVIVVNAGSSAGREDYTARVLSEVGSLVAHGAAIRPGKPVILGVAGGKPFLGLPGYPVSTILTAELFLKPLLCRWLGVPEPHRPRAGAVLSRPVTSPPGVEEFLRVKLGRVGERLLAVPMGKGAGALTTLIRADGLVRIPVGVEAWSEGTAVEVELLRPIEQIEASVLCAGSHDLLLDLLADETGARLSSAHVGSLAGIMALKRCEAHLAGIHLFDPETGRYNEDAVRRHLPGRKAVLFHLARRAQGLMVRPGNPAGLRGLDDLARLGVTFVNRQPGSGTRVLLDYHLNKLGLDPARISGYQHEVYTHTAVAAEVAGGGADAGLGLLAAAQAFGLDFIPVAEESYDLLIPAEFYDLPGIRAVLEAARSEKWRRRAAAVGGYDLSETGVERPIE